MKLSKIKKIGVMILAAFMMLSTFVACNAEIEDTVSSASVTFAPGIPKALNQSGEAGSVQDKDVSVYHWQYKFAQTEEKLEEEEYKNFNDDFSTTGLGTINGLIKGKQYYFALAGYTTATNASDATLVWEGQTESAIAITAKNTTVSITVKPMGKGNVFFDITSTVSDETKFTGATLNDEEKSDIYFITYAELSTNDDNTSATNTSFTDVTYSTDTDGVYMSYKTTSESGDLELAAGQYLFTIEQQKWNSTNSAYETVDGRGQVLIVTVEAGVKTYVKGSLDSSISTYVATNDIDVTFSDGDPDNVKSLIVTRTAESGSSAIVYDNSRIYVYDGQYVQLSFTQIDGTAENLKVYVNKYALDLTTDTNNYCADSTGKVTHIMKCADANKIKAYGAAGDDYIVTIRYNKQSMSFTIVGKDSTAATAKNKTAIVVENSMQNDAEYITLLTLNNTDNVTIENAKITKADAYSAADALSTGTDLTDVAERDLTLTLNVTEIESTASSTVLEIGMDSELVLKDKYGQQITAQSGEVHSFDNNVEISVQLAKNLQNVTVKHSGNSMQKVTSTTDFSTDTNYEYGMYCYDSDSGKLYIATKSLSPFTISFDDCEARIGETFYATLEDAITAAGTTPSTIVLLKDITSGQNDGSIYNLFSSYTIDYGYLISADADITIDLNGKTITAATVAANEDITVFYNIGKLTITDTSSSSDGMIYNSWAHDLALRCGCGIYSEKGSTLTINKGTIKVNGSYGIYLVSLDEEEKRTTLNINGGKIIGGYYGIFVNSGTSYTVNSGCNINITDGEIYSLGTHLTSANAHIGYALEAYSINEINITGGTIGEMHQDETSYINGIDCWRGTVNITGGTITAYLQDGFNDNAAAISANGQGGALTLNIGGSDTVNISSNDGALYVLPSNVSVNFNGNTSITGWVYTILSTLNVTGGTIDLTSSSITFGASTLNVSGGTADLASTITIQSGSTLNVSGGVINVVNDSETSYGIYNNGGTLCVTGGEINVTSNNSVNSNKNYGIYIYQGDFTISSGIINCSSAVKNYGIGIGSNAGTIDITGGTINVTGLSGSPTSYGIYSWKSGVTASDVTLNVSGSTNNYKKYNLTIN